MEAARSFPDHMPLARDLFRREAGYGGYWAALMDHLHGGLDSSLLDNQLKLNIMDRLRAR